MHLNYLVQESHIYHMEIWVKKFKGRKFSEHEYITVGGETNFRTKMCMECSDHINKSGGLESFFSLELLT